MNNDDLDEIDLPDIPEEEIEVVSFRNSNVCPICKSLSIELYDLFGKGVSFGVICRLKECNHEYLKYLDKYPIYQMKCKHCGKNFLIRWRDGFAYPMMDKEAIAFLRIYHQDNLKEGLKKS